VKKGLPFGKAVHSGLTELKITLRELRHRRVIARFLIARMLYQDGVNGVLILGGTFAAGMFGWGTMEIGIYGIILNIVAIGGCIAAGHVDQRLGSRTTVLISLTLLLVATLGIVSTQTDSTLFGLIHLPASVHDGLFSTSAEKAYLLYGILIGLAFGPVQASSRSYLSRNITVAEAGRYFGIYALSGRATSFMATLSFSIATYATGSAHVGMAMLTIFLGAGFLLLLRVPEGARPPQS
jgi:UMF1 family MFS transporter